jgi:hypothetical protein
MQPPRQRSPRRKTRSLLGTRAPLIVLAGLLGLALPACKQERARARRPDLRGVPLRAASNGVAPAKQPDLRRAPPHKAAPLPPELALNAKTARVVQHQLRLSRRFMLARPAENAVLSGWLAHAMTTAMQTAARDGRPFAAALGFAKANHTLAALGRLRRRVLADATRAQRGGRKLKLELDLGVFTAGATGPVTAIYGQRLTGVGATLRHLPQRDESRAVIDRWIAARTANTITDAFSREHQQMPELALVTTGYLRAPWELPFDVRDTAPGPFFSARCSAHDTPLMRKTMRLRSAETKLAYVVELPFVGKAFAMRLVVPKAVDGLRRYRRQLTELLHGGLKATLIARQIRLVLPRLKLPASINLLKTALTVVPELGQLRPYPHFGTTAARRLTRLAQYGFLRVEEWGAEAALAMIGTIGYGGAPRLLEVRADHPFLLSIHHVKSGAPLFAAQVFRLGQGPAKKLSGARCYRPSGPVSHGLGARHTSGVTRVRFVLTPSRGSEVTRRIIRRHVNELRYCAQRQRLTANAAACRMVLSIGSNGRSTIAPLPAGKAAKANAEAACQCMQRAARRWLFPKPRPGSNKPRTFTVKVIAPR